MIVPGGLSLYNILLLSAMAVLSYYVFIMLEATRIASAVFFTNSAASEISPARNCSVIPGKVVGAYPFVQKSCPVSRSNRPNREREMVS
jgi:hypothetical protein